MVLNPFPLDEAGGLVVTVACLAALGIAGVAVLQQLVLWFRARKLAGVARRIAKDPEPLRQRYQVQDLATMMGTSMPALGPAAEALARGSYESGGGVVSTRAPSQLFTPGLVRQPSGLVMLSDGALAAAPSIVLMTGLACAAAALGMAGDIGMDASMGLAGRSMMWAGLAAAATMAVTRISEGAGGAAVDALVGALESRLGGGSDAGMLGQLIEAQRATGEATERAGGSLEQIVASQASVQQSLVATHGAIEALGVQLEQTLGSAVRQAFADMPTVATPALSDDSTQLRRLTPQPAPALPAPVVPAPTQVSAPTQVPAEALNVVAQTSIDPQLMDELAARITAGVERALGDSLREAGDNLAQITRTQADTTRTWRESMSGLSQLVAELEQHTTALTSSAAALGQATAPTAAAAEKFQSAAERLDQVMGGMQQSAESNRSAAEAMRTTATSIQAGTKGFVDMSAAVEVMLGELRQTHETAIARVRSGVDEAVTGPLVAAGAQLIEATRLQGDQVKVWEDTMVTLAPALSDLKTTIGQLGGIAHDFEAAAKPTHEAGQALKEAAALVTTLFPRIEQSGEGYDQLNAALRDAANTLGQSAQTYRQASTEVGTLLAEVRGALHEQRSGQDLLVNALREATSFAEALPTASASMQQAAGNLDAASQRTASVVDNISTALTSQGQAVGNMRETADTLMKAMRAQATQWQTLHGQMSELHTVLDSGVDAFSQRLPKTVDRTLVQFDAALGEGVERLGSAVERLREALDDLHERLETVLGDAR